MRSGPSTCGKTDCDICKLDSKLMCRYGIKDSFFFLIAILPSFVVLIAGTIKAGLGVWLWAWLAYAVIFFLFIEPLVLCRYCPYWGMQGKELKCHANYGVIKFYKYKPGKSNRIEKALFILSALIFLCFPLILMFIGKQYLLFAIGAISIFSFIYTAKRSICTKCVNFSCPMNSVEEEYKKRYLDKSV